ncbi:hypothetical protein, partial [Acinetobacter sp. WCHAc060025]|uniref:hypothetical protein n=1 Tax=Acinetobacter sp. WCHAc060025 TaxID=2518625 RepID=UPI001BC872A3
EEIKDLITSDPKNNLGPDTTVTVDPQDPTKFIVTPVPTDPSKDVTVEIPTDSYEDKGGNLGGGDKETADLPPTVDITYDPNGPTFTIDFTEEPINPDTGKPFT